MVKKFVFNRKKEETIVLIHGLYTTSGFWLSYLHFFNNFRIVAFDIDYDKLLENEYFLPEELKKAFFVDGKVVAVISHSFGTVISDMAFDNNYEIIHKVCPVGFSKRADTSDFVLDIVNKTRLTADLISKNMKMVSSFISNVRKLLNYDGEIYIPNMDCYFSYDIPEKKRIDFNGDHFNISVALINIIHKLQKSIKR